MSAEEGGPPSTLYRFFDADRRLLYIGITSVQLILRWEQHRVDKPWWRQVAYAEFTHYDTRAEAIAAERAAIAAEDPVHNVAGKVSTFSRVCDRTSPVDCSKHVLVGPCDIAKRIGVPADTVHKWGNRGALPEPRWVRGIGPIWDWNLDIVPWLQGDPRRRHYLDRLQNAG